jgi:hypothetical protein
MSVTTTVISHQSELGGSVPPRTPHAISVSLPTWKDVVGYEEGEERVVQAMVTGYPRFFIHRIIQKVGANVRDSGARAERCEARTGLRAEVRGEGRALPAHGHGE